MPMTVHWAFSRFEDRSRRRLCEDDVMTAKRGRGRQSAAAEAQYQKQVAAFCKLILQIRSSMDFADQRSVRVGPA